MFDKNTPLIKRVCALTGVIETSRKFPECCGIVSGNFDGAFLSYGFLQWNVGQKTLQPILSRFIVENFNLAGKLLGNKLTELQNILHQSLDKQSKWALSIQNKKFVISPEWKIIFSNLGATVQMQDIQVDSAKNKYYARVSSFINDYNLKSERAVALGFDIFVQNGGIKEETKQIILSRFSPSDDEIKKMTIIVDERVKLCNPKWQNDVKNRKTVIVKNSGIIHGIKFDLEKDYAIGMNDAVL